ncbi:Alpha/beta hydrolase fold-1 [Dillenia turbinata]|uniref:Alpha/beta hydrolase fold-1 n=1 Tax=Dillenia turbinata TaxID=194707 RepID=A0AAN8Z2J1_9MAGN
MDESQLTYGNGPEKPPTSLLFGCNFSLSKLYRLCPPEIYALSSLPTKTLLLSKSTTITYLQPRFTLSSHCLRCLKPEIHRSRSLHLKPSASINSAFRPAPLFPDEVLLKVAAVMQEKYGSVPRVYIICDQDNALEEDFQMWMIEHIPPDEVKVIPGVSALDMAASGVDPKHMDEVHFFSDYVELLAELMASILSEEDGVILVGHSHGGICISVAMERFPEKIAAAVFVAAVMPSPDLIHPFITQQIVCNEDEVIKAD